MFDNLSDKFQAIFKTIKGKAVLKESNIQDALKQVRLALLEADVNFKIVKNFVQEIENVALGEKVLKSLNPSQQVIKIVKEQLTKLMGESEFQPNLPNNKINKVMFVGLQGSGKTTSCAKFANFARKEYKLDPLLVACDIYRPAAIEQLETLGKQIGIPVENQGKTDPVKICKSAIKRAEKEKKNLLIIDTAGRLHLDDELMTELSTLKKKIKPDYIFFVADAMTGQDAINSAKGFAEKVGIDASILTKLDSDARGGAALSIRAVSQKPIAFCGVGEKISDLEKFYPDRMASRILGMGDILSFIEKAEENIDQEEAEKTAKKMLKNQFTLEDFLAQLKKIQKMGSLSSMLKMIPGVNSSMLNSADLSPKKFKRTEAIITSMTLAERQRAKIIDGQRRKRIAKGSGSSVQEVNTLLRQFEQMKKMMKQFSNPRNRKNMLKNMGNMKGLPSNLSI